MMIELTDKQAILFRALAEAKAFDLKNGSFEVHFNGEGIPVKVHIHTYTQIIHA